MKKLSMFIALLGFIFSTNTLAQDHAINQDQLPKKISQYIQKHFPDNKIVKIEMEKDIFGPVEYEVKLNDRTEIEFEDTQMVDIESYSKLPDSVVPDKIAAYVKSNYPNNYITQIELKHNRQGVELNNDLELIFDKQGNFIKIDD